MTLLIFANQIYPGIDTLSPHSEDSQRYPTFDGEKSAEYWALLMEMLEYVKSGGELIPVEVPVLRSRKGIN